ncbi:hypothetical protein Glove_478g118 [Diversispora epigaea]|uniref:ZSWIM1/3 RNaseH-like domain-containing protein n=1 Tax=Diversispora epigaea TaxID=1348612 RepID=A0A397GME8_9GLOM|nr:hypothetical protein Glove_478g118 [Diversispora epigaea]
MSNNKIVHFTSDEKRALLFNIKNTLEISEEEFDNSWWPLVSNVWTQFNSCKLNNGDSWKVFTCRFTKHRESSTRKENIPIKKQRTTMIRPANICHAKIKVICMTSKKLIQIERYNNTPDHTHTLIESDRLKRSTAVRTLVMQEAIKNYPPVAIVKAVKEYANNELDLGESVKDLKRKEVANIKYKLHGPLETHLVGNIELESDILETISYLKNQEYYCERYYISQKSTYGIVFAHPKQLKKLHQYGWLTLIDSTHKTNKHDWRLFTLYIRDSYNCWDVGAHFFVSNEDSDTIAEALKIIRNICKNWIPGYVLMDQSNIEANSIKKVFPGLKAGENECRIILCTVHIVRTWIAKIYEKKTREIMIGAMHKRTKIGCEQFIQNAIQQFSVSAVCNFIKRNYMKNSHKWALWAQQHSPLLLQVTSTNALESYHNEKRALLFNIKNTLEISEEEFDNSWWPLVSNVWTQFNSCKLNNGDSWKVFTCRFTKHRESSTRKENIPIKKQRTTMIRPANICHAKIKVICMTSKKLIQIERYNNTPDHTHTLIESDRLKRSTAVRTLVMQEAIKNYPPVAIVKAVKEYANNELDLGESVKDLKRKEVANIKYKLHGPLETHLVGNIELESDILETISYLKNQEYYCERYYISQKSTYRIVFAHPKQLKKLHQYGWLTLIDSTHKTNKHDWRLFTLYIRDSYNCWDVGAHFFVSNEDSDTIAEALKIIRNICKNWIPGYVLMDQSNIEANSIKKVFPGLKAGENECRIILCTVHIVRTWIAKIYEKKTREIMIGAMHKRTKIGCEQFIQNAIQQFSVSAVCNFIKRNYMKNSHKWALWARQHSPLLLQVTSTNALESYHSELKRTTSFLYGLIGLFEENGFEIYEQRELVIEEIPIQTDAEKKIENRRHTVNELTERVRNKYWSAEEIGASQAEIFVNNTKKKSPSTKKKTPCKKEYSPPSTVEVVNNIVLQVRMSGSQIET